MNLLYLIKLFFDIIISSFMGFIIDDIGVSIQKKNNIKPLNMTLLQIIFNIFLIYYLKTHLRPYFDRTWLETLRGLFFVTFYFNMQRNLYKNIELTYKYYFSK
jgi:hypothetical protein